MKVIQYFTFCELPSGEKSQHTCAAQKGQKGNTQQRKSSLHVIFHIPQWPTLENILRFFVFNTIPNIKQLV